MKIAVHFFFYSKYIDQNWTRNTQKYSETLHNFFLQENRFFSKKNWFGEHISWNLIKYPNELGKSGFLTFFWKTKKGCIKLYPSDMISFLLKKKTNFCFNYTILFIVMSRIISYDYNLTLIGFPKKGMIFSIFS